MILDPTITFKFIKGCTTIFEPAATVHDQWQLTELHTVSLIQQIFCTSTEHKEYRQKLHNKNPVLLLQYHSMQIRKITKNKGLLENDRMVLRQARLTLIKETRCLRQLARLILQSVLHS